MGVLRALLRNDVSSRRNRTSKNARRDPRRRFVRENRVNFEPLEARVVLANTSADGAFSVLLDNAPGDVNGFDGNLALYQSGLVYNSRSVADGSIQFAESNTLPSFGGSPPSNVRADLTFDGVSQGSFYWTVDTSVGLNDDLLFRVPLDFTVATGRHKWSISATYSRGGYSDVVRTYGTAAAPNYMSYVNRESSEFGKGWFQGELATIKMYSGTGVEPNGLLLITGDGEPTWFQNNGSGSYVREVGDQYFYTVTDDGTYFTLTDKFGSSMKFQKNTPVAGESRLVGKFDASGNELRFTYFASDHIETQWRNKLQTVQNMPTGDTTTFAYSTTTGALTTITETVGSNSRAAIVSVTSSQLASITLPDPDSGGALASPVWSFECPSRHNSGRLAA